MEYKLPERFENSNKSTYGKVLNIAGSDYMSGAAYLSSVSALKVGCGYCYLCSTERVIDAVAAQTQNIVFLPYDNFEKFLKFTPPDVVSIGCGLSQDSQAVEIFNKFLNNVSNEIPVIIDADGLNIISKNSELFISKGFKHCVFTPHPKEAARLLGCSLENVLLDVEASAFKISEIYKCITVLKTHKTIVTAPDGKKYINTTGNNCLAKAGSGDVLTGMITGLTAQSKDLFEASVLGAYAHGLCGDFAKEKLTEYSVMAEDLISYIPNAFKYILD
ncbi:NAD(P)H-hydrate dehydratase [bacterium]|nr:NAD(P)H-hydrate dehydratase [bacterium]